MCGIAAIVRAEGSPPLSADIRAMCDAIVQRGPDDAGYYTAGPVALGMRRLSIIDVSGGHQPIANEDESRWIVFNGEIYNHHELRERLEGLGHRFRTKSDTEVILHGHEQWGDDVVHELHGMFAFAVWDGVRERLFAARDHLGIKPLCYWLTDDGIALGSELRSFLSLPAFPRRLSREALVSYIALGYVPPPLTIFEEARKLAPGCRLSWTRSDGFREERYWEPTSVPAQALHEADAVSRLRVLLEEAVVSHLESEVPLGAFLSGGMDSSAVVALMCRASARKVRTFSIGFREAGFDESAHAAEVAKALGTEHTAITLTPNARRLLARVAVSYDEPFADPSALPTLLVSALAREHVTVSLSGDGGDELFGGYGWYKALAGRPASPGPLGSLARFAAAHWPAGLPGRGRVLDFGAPRAERMNARHVAPLAVADGGLLSAAAAAGVPRLGDWFASDWERAHDRDFVTQMALVDLTNYLPGCLLTKVDRASMAVSLEARVPFLHRPLVEFALSLPGHMKVRAGATKYLFRRAIADLVPAAVLTYGKRGFDVPLGQWFRGELRSELDTLHELHDVLPGFLDPDALSRVIDGHLRGRGDWSAMLWRLLVLRRWLVHLEAGDLAGPLERGSVADLMREGPEVAQVA